MGTKRRTVVNAEPEQIDRAQALVAEGRYRTLSDFVREAMAEKLARVEDARLADEVTRYCATGHAEEDADLIAAQVLERPSRPPRRTKKATRAAR